MLYYITCNIKAKTTTIIQSPYEQALGKSFLLTRRNLRIRTRLTEGQLSRNWFMVRRKRREKKI